MSSFSCFSNDPFKVLRAGHLKKAPSNSILLPPQWSDYYVFVTNRQTIHYLHDLNRGEASLVNATVATGSNETAFIVRFASGDSMEFACSSSEEATEWIGLIGNVIPGNREKPKLSEFKEDSAADTSDLRQQLKEMQKQIDSLVKCNEYLACQIKINHEQFETQNRNRGLSTRIIPTTQSMWNVKGHTPNFTLPKGCYLARVTCSSWGDRFGTMVFEELQPDGSYATRPECQHVLSTEHVSHHWFGGFWSSPSRLTITPLYGFNLNQDITVRLKLINRSTDIGDDLGGCEILLINL